MFYKRCSFFTFRRVLHGPFPSASHPERLSRRIRKYGLVSRQVFVVVECVRETHNACKQKGLHRCNYCSLGRQHFMPDWLLLRFSGKGSKQVGVCYIVVELALFGRERKLQECCSCLPVVHTNGHIHEHTLAALFHDSTRRGCATLRFTSPSQLVMFLLTAELNYELNDYTEVLAPYLHCWNRLSMKSWTNVTSACCRFVTLLETFSRLLESAEVREVLPRQPLNVWMFAGYWSSLCLLIMFSDSVAIT